MQGWPAWIALLAKACLAATASLVGCRGLLGARRRALACDRPWAWNPHVTGHEHRIARNLPWVRNRTCPEALKNSEKYCVSHSVSHRDTLDFVPMPYPTMI